MVLWAGLAACADAPYHWPLDLPKLLTSSFAEYRVGRFHAGIDLRTGGIGKAVHAADDGYVCRVRCSPWGYGKAVYLRLEDGHTVVYAHLDAFAEPLAGYVRAAQHARQSYTVDLYPEAGKFPVSRGEVIARSGQTGTGVPHLHYEFRDAAERPVNPRLLGITWPDSTRPVIRKVVIAPAGPDTRLGADIVPLVREARRKGPGEYVCDPVSAYGRIGFGLDVIDPANKGATKLGVYLVRTVAGDEELFRVRNDRLSYDTNRNGVVAFHPFFLSEGRFLLQWRWPGNECEPFQCAASDGWFTVPEEPVEIRIETEDFLGNRAAVTIPVRPEVPLPETGLSQGGVGAGKMDIECLGNWILLTASFDAPEPDAPQLEVDGPASAQGGRFRRVGPSAFRAGYLPPADAREVTLRVRHERIAPYERHLFIFQRGVPGRTVELGRAELRVRPNSPYGTLFARGYTPGSASTRIRLLDAPCRIWPADSPIDEPVEISFPVPDGVEQRRRVHVYEKRSWGWLRHATRREGDRLTISTRRLGTFAVMEDDQAPRITNVVPADGARLTSARPPIRASVSDVGSGIETITVTCNGHWLLMEYDPERGVINWARDEDLPAGRKELVFTVADAAGNSTVCKRAVDGP